jgi:hypothetical protein
VRARKKRRRRIVSMRMSVKRRKRRYEQQERAHSPTLKKSLSGCVVSTPGASQERQKERADTGQVRKDKS